MKISRFALLLILLLSACGTSKSVSYSHHALAADGCTVSYSVVKQEAELSIIATVKSDRLIFSAQPLMTLWNFNGEVLKLDGINLQSRTESAGIVVSNMVLPITEISAIASFPISREQVPFLRSGIQKVRLSTVPIVHEKTFSEDVIGYYLLGELNKAIMQQD